MHYYVIMGSPLDNREGLSLERLRSFLLVADSGGMTAAAPRNPVRQSQLSRQIGELEKFFGRDLFEKRGRGIVLTGAGERLAVIVRETVRGLESVATEAEDAPFSLGAGDSLLHWRVIPRIGRALKSVPHTTVRLLSRSSADSVAQALDARLDFAIVPAAEVPTGLESRRLGVLDHAFYAPKVLLPDGPAHAEKSLASLPLAVQKSEFNERLIALAKKLGGPNVAFECETFPQACRAVQSGLCAALLPTLAAGDLPARAFYALALPGLRGLSIPMALVWHPRVARTRPRAAELARALEKGLQL